MTAYQNLQDSIFDGSWARHATHLLSHLVNDFVESPFGALVLPQETFFPGSWLPEDLVRFYQNHDEEASRQLQSTYRRLDELCQEIPHGRPRDMESRLSHFVRSARLASCPENGYQSPEAKTELFGNPDGGITIDYILSRKSNFAIALYPALKEALDTGVLKPTDDLSVLSEMEASSVAELRHAN